MLLVSIPVVEAFHLPKRPTDVLPLVGEDRFVRFAPMISVVDDAEGLTRGCGVNSPIPQIRSQGDVQRFTGCDCETSRGIPSDCIRVTRKAISFPERKYRSSIDVIGRSLAEIYDTYPEQWLIVVCVISRIDNLQISSKVGLGGLLVRTSLNPTENDSARGNYPGGDYDMEGKFSVFRLMFRIVSRLIALILVLIDCHCMSIAVLPDILRRGRYRGRAQLDAWLLVAAALTFIHLGFVIYGTDFL